MKLTRAAVFLDIMAIRGPVLHVGLLSDLEKPAAAAGVFVGKSRCMCIEQHGRSPYVYVRSYA